MRAHFEEETARAALLLEAAAYALLRCRPPSARKAAFHLVLAGKGPVACAVLSSNCMWCFLAQLLRMRYCNADHPQHVELVLADKEPQDKMSHSRPWCEQPLHVVCW